MKNENMRCSKIIKNETVIEYKHLIVLTIGAYPYGGPSTNRHLSYLKGLTELGVDVKVLIIKPSENKSKKNNNICGVYNGIHYEYMQPLLLNKNPFLKIFWKFKSRINAFIKTIKLVNENKRTDTRILDLITSPIDILPYLAISKFYNVKIFHEVTEYPFLYRNTIFQKMSLNLYLKFLIPRFDGIFLITNSLLEYFSKYVKEKSKLIHIPMTVEPERFTNESSINNKYGTYIAYCGSMYTNIGIPMYIDKSGPVYEDKDGVTDLITAFNYLCAKVNNINLVLIGDNSNEIGFKNIQDCINASPYNERIFCTGLIDRDNMPELLNSALILAMARPDNLQAQGGFPTKLGEYLSTGNPVVITDVGEISNYLQDRVSAFIAPPNNPKIFGEKLFEAISNPIKARKVGEEGRKVALNYFDYKVQAKRLYDFLYMS